jgi:hypothetical protein
MYQLSRGSENTTKIGENWAIAYLHNHIVLWPAIFADFGVFWDLRLTDICSSLINDVIAIYN